MTCPNCGADVPPQAKACPECGSCEEAGWSESAESGGLDLPDDEFNYDEFVKKEFGSSNPKPRGISWFWWIVAILLIVVLAVFFLRFR